MPIEQSKQIVKQKTTSLLQNPIFYFVVAVACLFGSIFFFVLPQYNEFMEIKVSLIKIKDTIYGNPEKGVLGKKNEKTRLESQRADLEKEFNSITAEKNDILNDIFPETDDVQYLTNLLEKYALEHDSEENPFILNSLNFSKPRQDNSQNVKATYLSETINLPLQLSEKNFIEFIEFINQSGSMQKEDFYKIIKRVNGEEKTFYYPVPLMTIESLNFTYSDPKDKYSPRMVNASFILNTYIRSVNDQNVGSKK